MDKEDRYAAEALAALRDALRSLREAEWRYSYCQRYTDKERVQALASILTTVIGTIDRPPGDAD